MNHVLNLQLLSTAAMSIACYSTVSCDSHSSCMSDTSSIVKPDPDCLSC